MVIMRARDPLLRLSVVGVMSMMLSACAHDQIEFLAAGGREPVVVAPADAGWSGPVVQAAYDAGPADLNGPYVLDTGDRLRVFVYGQPNLSRAYTVIRTGASPCLSSATWKHAGAPPTISSMPSAAALAPSSCAIRKSRWMCCRTGHSSSSGK